MESVGKTPECVEGVLGEVLAARNAAIANAGDVPGVGPPDLCWIQRTGKGIFNTKKPKRQGYYHWVVGLAVTSGASIAAYFARLTSTSKKVGYFQGMGVGREFTIERAIYCCYDPFSDMDIWVEMAAPGGAVSRGLDRQGYLHDVTTEMWRGVHVGCFMRSELYDVSVTLHCSRAFQHMTFFKSQHDETDLLNSVTELYRLQLAQIAMERIQWDKGQGTEPYHMDVICTALLEHFKKRRRWQKALQFFTELQLLFPSSAVYQAEIYRELDNEEGAADLITSALQDLKKEDHPMLVLACGYVFLRNDKFSKASKAAQSVLDNDPHNRPAWLLLGQSLLCQGYYDKSLRALNLMPPPLVPSDRRAMLFRTVPPKPRFTTRRFSFYNPEVSEIGTVYEESKRMGVMMPVVPGQILVHRTQFHGSDWGVVSGTQNVMRSAYDLLLDHVQTVGWEKFCQTRAAVFLLPGDEDASGGLPSDGNPVTAEMVVDETAANRLVSLSLTVKERSPWELPRRKTNALYARSMSIGTTPTGGGEAERSPSETPNPKQIAAKVLTRGLGQITKKVLRRQSSTSASQFDDLEHALPPRTASKVISRSSTMEDMHFKHTEETEPEHQMSQSIPRSPSVSLRKRVEVVTTVERLPSDDEVPDAPENALPKQCPPYSMEHSRYGPPSSTGVSQDKWQVKVVAMGIKDRVKYFNQVAKEKIAKQHPGSRSNLPVENETCVAHMRPRRARYSVTQTIMEKLIHDVPIPESSADIPSTSDGAGSGDADASSGSNEAVVPHSTDWGTFALDDASRVPRSHPRTQTVPYDPFGSGALSDIVANGLRGAVHDATPCECAEWLEELILALWEDLALYTDFKQLDRKLKSKNMQTHAEQILGTIEWNADTTDEDDSTRTPTAGPALPDSRPVDWMRRGLLCERLRKPADAEQSYRVCIFLSFNLTSLLALSRIYAEWGYSKGSLLMLNRIAQYHHKKHSSQKDLYLPESFVQPVSHLLESVGNKDLKAAAENSHPLVAHAVEDVLKWHLAMRARQLSF